MDLSKLRRLSGDRKPDEQAPLPAADASPPAEKPLPEAVAYDGEPLISGATIWLSLVFGAVLMYMGWDFVQWLFAELRGQPYDTGVDWTAGPRKGLIVPYWEIRGHLALSESAMFLFGLSMVLEAVVLFAAMQLPRFARGLILSSLLLTATMTIYNLIAVVVLMRDGVTPLVSAVAVAFGGYVVISQWGLLKRLITP